MAHLQYLLSTKEGREYVALCLVDAFHNHEEIRPGLPREPYPHMTLDDIAQTQTEDIARRAHLVLHVNKSRDTDQGWVVVERFPSDFIKGLPPTMEVEQHSLHKTLGDLAHAREQVTELQKRGTTLKSELEKWKTNMLSAEQAAKERLKEIVCLKLDKEDLEKRVAELKTTTGLQYLDELKKLKEDNRNLETTLKDTRVTCPKCGESFPIDAPLTCEDCVQKHYQMQCESCGDNIPSEDGCYCEDCHDRVVKKAQTWEATGKAVTEQRDEFEKQAMGWQQKAVQHEADLKLAKGDIEKLHQLLGQAVVAMNSAEPMQDSPWMKKYRALHEKYLHQTPTGRVVDLKDDMAELRSKNIELANANQRLKEQNVHLQAKVDKAWEAERKAVEELHDPFVHQVIDSMGDYYQPRDETGFDYDAIDDGIANMHSICERAEFGRLRQDLEREFKTGKTNAAIAQSLGLDGEHVSASMVALLRRLMK